MYANANIPGQFEDADGDQEDEDDEDEGDVRDANGHINGGATGS